MKNAIRNLNLGMLVAFTFLLASCSTIHKNGMYQTKRYTFGKHEARHVNKSKPNRKVELLQTYLTKNEKKANSTPAGINEIEILHPLKAVSAPFSKIDIANSTGQFGLERNSIQTRQKSQLPEQVVQIDKSTSVEGYPTGSIEVSDSLRAAVKSELKPHRRAVGILSIIGAALIGITIAMDGLVLGVIGVYLLLLIPLYIAALLAIRRHKFSKNTPRARIRLAIGILASAILTFVALGASLYSLSILLGYFGGALLIYLFTLLIANSYAKSTRDNKRRDAILMSIGAFVVSLLYVVLTYGLNALG